MLASITRTYGLDPHYPDRSIYIHFLISANLPAVGSHKHISPKSLMHVLLAIREKARPKITKDALENHSTIVLLLSFLSLASFGLMTRYLREGQRLVKAAYGWKWNLLSLEKSL